MILKLCSRAYVGSTQVPAAIAATLVLVYLIGFWFAWPFVERLQRRTGFLSKEALDL